MVDKTENYLDIERKVKTLALSSNPADSLLYTVLRFALKTFESIEDQLIAKKMLSRKVISKVFNTQETQDKLAETITNIMTTQPGARVDSSKVDMGMPIADYLGINPAINLEQVKTDEFVDAIDKSIDNSNRILASGAPVPEDYSHTELKENGQQKEYVVLSPEERAKGFVRKLRTKYIHVGTEPVYYKDSHVLLKLGANGCGTLTKMSLSIAETYATNPKFYSGTFCCGCNKHLPLEEFVWEGTNEIVGS